MKILVDADACPVVKTVEQLAKKYNISVCLYADSSHVLRSTYSAIKTVLEGRDSADFAILSDCMPGDIVVTGDHGLAAMVLAINAHPIHNNGTKYTDKDVETLLALKHLYRKCRRCSRKHLKRMSFYTGHEPSFRESLESLILQTQKIE